MHSQPTYKEIFDNLGWEASYTPPPAPPTLTTNPIFADINKQLQNMLDKINNFTPPKKAEEKPIVKQASVAKKDVQHLHKKLDNISMALLAEYRARQATTNKILAKLNFLVEAMTQLKRPEPPTSPLPAPAPVAVAVAETPAQDPVPAPRNWQESLAQLFSEDTNLPPFGLHPYQDPLSKEGADRLIKRAANYQKALKKEPLQAI